MWLIYFVCPLRITGQKAETVTVGLACNREVKKKKTVGLVVMVIYGSADGEGANVVVGCCPSFASLINDV